MLGLAAVYTVQATVENLPLVGAGGLQYVIGSLNTGTPYIVCVLAGNREGYGGFAMSSPLSPIPRGRPDKPTNVRLIGALKCCPEIGVG